MPQQDLQKLLGAVLPHSARAVLDCLTQQGLLEARSVPGLSHAPPAIFGAPRSLPSEVSTGPAEHLAPSPAMQGSSALTWLQASHPSASI